VPRWGTGTPAFPHIAALGSDAIFFLGGSRWILGCSRVQQLSCKVRLKFQREPVPIPGFRFIVIGRRDPLEMGLSVWDSCAG